MLIIRLLAENSHENCKTCLFNAYSSHKELCELSVARKHASGSASHENCKMCLRYTRTFVNVTATYSHEKCKICLFYACSSHIELRELSVARIHATASHENCKTWLFHKSSNHIELWELSVITIHTANSHEKFETMICRIQQCDKIVVNRQNTCYSLYKNCETFLFYAYSSQLQLWESFVTIVHATASHENCETCLFYA